MPIAIQRSVKREARGKLLVFLGHDNLYFPDHLERLAIPFAQDAAQIAYSRPLWIRDDGVIAPFFVNLTQSQARKSFMTVGNVLPATNVVYRRARHETVSDGPEGSVEAGDWVLWKRILTAHPGGMRLVRAPTCLHFRADWRDPNRWTPAPAAYLGLVHDSGRAWEKGMDLQLKAKLGLPQAQMAALLQAEGAQLVSRISVSTERLGDMLV